MPHVAYVNGRYLPHDRASVHVEDRAHLFADGVYEVCEVRGGRLIDENKHMARLDRSLGELRIAPPMSRPALGVVLREIIRRNRIDVGLIYLQISRGVAPRAHQFPIPAVSPSLVVTGRRADPLVTEKRAEAGVSVITVPDDRWDRVDIKTVSLLPNVLAKQRAREAGAFEAWFVTAAGEVTEGASTNAWIVTSDQKIVTPPADFGVLRGVTRAVVLELAARLGLEIIERRFTVAEALAAAEAFLTSATMHVTPIVRIDGVAIGTGRPGKVARALREQFQSQAEIAPQFSTAIIDT